MNNGKGYVPIHRQIEESEVFEDAELLRLWLWLILNANFKDGQLLNGQTLAPGQLVLSLGRAAKMFKCDKSTIKRRLTRLEKMGNIATVGATAGTTVTICHWEIYNSSSSGPATVDATTTQRSRNDDATTVQPEVKGKKGKREELNPLSPTATVAAEKKLAAEENLLKRERNFIALWNDLDGVRKARGSSLEGKRRGYLRARLAENGWPVECVEAFKRFPLQCFGVNGWKPDIEWILQKGNVNKILEGKYDFTKESDEETPEPLDIAGALERCDKDKSNG